ncbi:MAG: VRR-NUC domain-containing protein [Acutalibacteraceae bacterium]
MVLEEKDIERRLKNKITALRGMCIKLELMSYTGMPDRLILLPGGYCCFVELKKPGKKERKRQEYVQSLLRSLGFIVYSSVDTFEKVDIIIRDYERIFKYA